MTDEDCQARLAKIARVLPSDDQYWTGGATHAIETTDCGLFGIGTEVYFLATKQAGPRNCVVFLHRTRRKAIERRLIKRTRDGWEVWRISGQRRNTKERIDRKTWCGGYRVVASMMPTERKDALRRAIDK